MKPSPPRLASALAALALVALAAAPASASATTRACSGRPSALAFTRQNGRTFGRLSWTAPAGRRTFRVWRGRRVVGQTRRRAIRVNVRIGGRYTLSVAPVAGGRVRPGCRAARRFDVAYRLPTAPGAVGVRAAELSWAPSRRGDSALAGYRVLRDGRVAGQTRATRYAVKGTGGAQRLQVLAVDVRGRTSAASAAVVYRPGHTGPSAPGGLTGRALSATAVELSWTPATAASGARIVGYRIHRNGVALGQQAGRTAEVGRLSPSTAYTFAVQAADNHGALSAPVEVVVRTADHQAPSVPAGLTARALSDSEIVLDFGASGADADSRVVGYRVLRDGVPTGQFDTTTVHLTNLRASTTYTFGVQAADNAGALSAPAEVSVRTADPVPTSGHAVAFLLASTDASFVDFRAHYRQIGTVSPTYYDCTAAGALIGRDDPLVSQWAQARKVTLLPRVNCQSTATLHAILTDPARRAAWLDEIVALSLEHGFDGVTLDFEAGAAADRNAYSSFVSDLAARLHAQGDQLMVAVSAKTADVPNHPRSTFFDYQALARAADRVFVMAWGIHWATSAPGAQDDIRWVAKVTAYVRTMPDPGRFTLGMQLYAMDWPAGGGVAHPAGASEYADTQALIAHTGAQVRYDAAQDAMAFTYTDPFGIAHDVWYTDALTEGRRIQLARDNGLGGVGVWRLGEEDQRIWEHPALAPGVAW